MRITRILLLLLSAFCFSDNVFSQITDTFTVQGDATKFYPVSFYNGGYDNNVATTVEIGRSIIHEAPSNTDWWGSITAKIRFHTN